MPTIPQISIPPVTLSLVWRSDCYHPPCFPSDLLHMPPGCPVTNKQSRYGTVTSTYQKSLVCSAWPMFLWLNVLPPSAMLAQPSCITITRNHLTQSRDAPSLSCCPSVHAAHPVHRVLSLSLNHTPLSQSFPFWLSSCHRCPLTPLPSVWVTVLSHRHWTFSRHSPYIQGFST